MKSLICTLIAGCLLPGASLIGQQTPKTMTKVVVQLQSPDVPQDSFGAKPKTMYRAGSRYCRVEELPDPEHGIHGLLVVNEPDAWMVNLADHTAKHIVDPGPTFNCRLPVFQGQVQQLPPEEEKAIAELEFGREIEFFKKGGAGPQVGPVLQGQQTTAYQLHFGESTIELFTYSSPVRVPGHCLHSGPGTWFTTPLR